MAQITLGNIFQSGGKNVVGGSQSGLDTEGIVKALTEAKRLPAVRLEDKNKTIDKKLEAYTALKSMLSRFQTAVDVLRNPPGVGNASQNIFQYRTSTLTSTGTTAAGNYMAMTVQPGAAIQNFTITSIDKLALATKQNSAVFSLPSADTSVVKASGDTTAGFFSAGNITLRNVTGGDPVAISLSENDSLSSVVNKFNAVKGTTGIQANILKVGSGTPNSSYQIVFSATQSGTDYGFDLESAGTVLSDTTGVLTQVTNQVDFGTTQAAQNAQVHIDGVLVERQTNAIDDAVEGITFTLKQTMTDGSKINAAITPDTDIVKNAITSFSDIYNEFRVFAAQQQEIGIDGLPAEGAVLANEVPLRSLVSQMASEVTSAISGITGGNPDRLADIGINFDTYAGDEDHPLTRNIMVIDTDKLSSALAANFDGVRGLFEFTMTADNPNLAVFSRTNQLNVSEFSIERTAGGLFKVHYTNDQGIPQVVEMDSAPLGANGVTLTGKTGTPFEGLQLLYAAHVTTFGTINVNVSQGFGDRLYNLMDNVLDADEGSLTQAITNYEDQETRNKDEITDIDSKIETYRQQLLDQYAALESSLTKANQLLALLDAQASAREANS